METTQMTISRGMDKKDIVYTDNGTLFSYKKNTIMSFSIRWMDLEIIILSKVSQRERLIWLSLVSYDITCIWNLK